MKFDLGLPSQPSQPPAKQKTGKLSSPGRDQRVTTRKGFVDALMNRGVDGLGVGQATDALYQAGFNQSTNELYRQHGATPGNRDGLPEGVQDQIQIYELVNKRRIQKHNQKAFVESHGQEAVNDELSGVVYDQTQKTRKFLGGLF